MTRQGKIVASEVLLERNVCCTFEDLRSRAYQLADTGRFDHWEQVCAEIEREDCPGALRRVRSDPMLRRMLNARCNQAKDQP